MAVKHGILAISLAATFVVVPRDTRAQDARPDEPRVLVQQVTFEGSEALSDEVLSKTAGPLEGKELSLGDLRKLAAAVAEEYHARGYFLAQVIVPEQNMQDGIVTLQILEGRLGEIVVTGNQHCSVNSIRKPFAALQRAKAIRQGALERALLVLDEYPGMEANAVLRGRQGNWHNGPRRRSG